MEVIVDDRAQPLFEQLLRVARAARTSGVPLRLIGGAAMQLWGRRFEEPRDMTEDLDWALTRLEIAGVAEVETKLGALRVALEALGYRIPETWPDRPHERYKLVHADSGIAVEFLCGSLEVGRLTRRPPLYELSRPIHYAARTPWIDKVDPWVEVAVQGSADRGIVWIPDVPSMVLLKAKAVFDKLRRLLEPGSDQQIAHERRRLERHAGDLLAAIAWAEAQGEFIRLRARIVEDGEIQAVLREAARLATGSDLDWLTDRADLCTQLERFARITQP